MLVNSILENISKNLINFINSEMDNICLKIRSKIIDVPLPLKTKIKIEYDTELYKKRNLIERIFGRIKENRPLAVRYEKSDLMFLAFITLAFIKINLC